MELGREVPCTTMFSAFDNILGRNFVVVGFDFSCLDKRLL
jgi:hypothetical protein